METTITITKVLTTTQDGLVDVIKKIYYNLLATKGGETHLITDFFVELDSADPNAFIPYTSLTKGQVEAMITSSSSYQGLLSHVEKILDGKIAEKSLVQKPLPF
jgi:hypothetical protein